MDSFGVPIQILKYDQKTKSYNLNLIDLEKILLSERVCDANIAVVSIAGAFRKGKSFLLSFLLRYLDSVYEKRELGDWLGDVATHLEGFSWRGGSERDTTGIWIWSRIFVHQKRSGEKIGVILMDTQGTFDNKSTMKDNVTIFALSTMLSSVQIFNLFDTIQENDLHHLQLFTEYGKLAMENSSEKAFQHLLFLIRDWRFNYELPYGYDGGQEHLNRILVIDEEQDGELTYVRTHLQSCYEKLNCFLMPHPGPIVTMSEFFKGQLKDMGDDFVESLKELIPLILSPLLVETKRINGNQIHAKDFLFYIQSYWKVFVNGTLPTAMTILAATTEANLLSVIEECVDRYESTLREITADDTEILEFKDLVNVHNIICTETLNLFIERAAFGDDHIRTSYYEKLIDKLQKLLTLYVGRNEAKRAEDMNDVISNMTTQMDDYKEQNEHQRELVVSLEKNLEEFRVSSNAEKEALREEINNMKNQPRPTVRKSRGKCVLQ